MATALLPVSLSRAQTTQNVATDWALIPKDSSNNPLFTDGQSFRLLFVTSTTRDTTSTSIATYNTFVQTRAAANTGISGVTGLSGKFRALISTATVDARENTDTESSDTDAPIYWLGGAKVADDYADFYDGSWDSVAGKTETGGTWGGLVSTGSNADGTKHETEPSGSGSTVHAGILSDGTPLSGSSVSSGASRRLYALSPVITVQGTTPPPTTTAPPALPPPPPPPPPVITSAEGVTYSGNAKDGFSLTPLGEGGSIVYRRRTVDLPVTRDECLLPGNPAVIISRSVLDRVREMTFELYEVPPQEPPPGFRLEGCVAEIDPGVRLGQRETVTVCLPPAEVQGESYIYRYDGSGEWKRLESRPETVNGEELLCGKTDAFSLFGVLIPVITSAEGVLYSEDAEDIFSLTPLGEGGSMVYGDRTIDLSVTGDVDLSSEDPAVIVSRSVLDRVREITFELYEVSPQDPPPGLHLSGFALETDLGITLGEGETVGVCLPSSGGDIYRYNDLPEEWELLESRSETVNGEEVVCAETGAVSLTGVFAEETGGCVIAAVEGEGRVRWPSALFNLLLTISVLLLLPGMSKLKVLDN